MGGSAVLEAYDGAWRATENDNRDEVHPIRCVQLAVAYSTSPLDRDIDFRLDFLFEGVKTVYYTI